MPNLPVIQQQVSAQSVPNSASVPRDNSVAAATQGLAAEIGATYERTVAKRRNDQIVAAEKAFAEFQEAELFRFDEAKKAAVDDPVGFAESYKEAYAQRASDLLDSMELDDDQRARMDQTATQYGFGVTRSAMAYESARASQKSVEDFDGFTNAQLNVIQADPRALN